MINVDEIKVGDVLRRLNDGKTYVVSKNDYGDFIAGPWNLSMPHNWELVKTAGVGTIYKVSETVDAETREVTLLVDAKGYETVNELVSQSYKEKSEARELDELLREKERIDERIAELQGK